jgi:hypothetical protein
VEGDAPDTISVTDECLEVFAGGCIPEADCVIITAAGEQHLIGAECNCAYSVGVAGKGDAAQPFLEIPEADGLIVAATGKHSFICTEGQGPGAVGMPGKRMQEGAIRCRIDPDVAGRGTCSQHGALRTECHGKNVTERIGKAGIYETCRGEIDLSQRHILEVGLPDCE